LFLLSSSCLLWLQLSFCSPLVSTLAPGEVYGSLSPHYFVRNWSKFLIFWNCYCKFLYFIPTFCSYINFLWLYLKDGELSSARLHGLYLSNIFYLDAMLTMWSMYIFYRWAINSFICWLIEKYLCQLWDIGLYGRWPWSSHHLWTCIHKKRLTWVLLGAYFSYHLILTVIVCIVLWALNHMALASHHDYTYILALCW
jgi:hypothetical protein